MVSRTNKFRGSRTHGRGKKAGRGAGLRGGRGRAGLHKHKYISVVKYMPDYFGSHGFKRPRSVVREKLTINLSEIEQRIDAFKKNGIAETRDGRLTVNLRMAGIDKLLGAGRISTPIDIIVESASERAKEKLANAGGKLLEE